MMRDQKFFARKALIDFGQMSKNKGFLFDDDGVDLLSRLADKRPQVIGGKVNVNTFPSHLTILEVGY